MIDSGLRNILRKEVHLGFVCHPLLQIWLDKIPFMQSISGFPAKGGIQFSALLLLNPDT